MLVVTWSGLEKLWEDVVVGWSIWSEDAVNTKLRSDGTWYSVVVVTLTLNTEEVMVAVSGVLVPEGNVMVAVLVYVELMIEWLALPVEEADTESLALALDDAEMESLPL